MSRSSKGKTGSRVRAHAAALAFTVDGDVLINGACFDGSNAMSAVVQRALDQPGRVFVGVVLTKREVAEALGWLTEAATEGTGYIIGRRQRRSGR